MNKKAAMFGLDARIALAIFGALSVISGAALYSAIQQAKVTALVTDFKEIEKAIEQYVLDTGTDTPHNKSSADGTSGCLVLSSDCTSANNWNGPYLPYKRLGSGYVDHPLYNYVYLRNNLDTEWGHPSEDSGAHFCSADTSKTCYHWIMINGVSLDLQKAVDKFIDGEDSAIKGNVRYVATELYMKSIPTISQL
tara:strand:+ start:1610 stop:2191 length:582 start_codon:yes stop_codon:yes gene_type:complete